MNRISRTIRVVIVMYLESLALALLWAPCASEARTVVPPVGRLPVLTASTTRQEGGS